MGRRAPAGQLSLLLRDEAHPHRVAAIRLTGRLGAAQAAAVACAALLALLALAAAADGGSLLLHVDRPVHLWALDRRTAWAGSAARALTGIGAPAPAFALGLALAAAAWARAPAIGLAILGLTLARPLASTALKELVDRDRPSVGSLVGASGQSFPSGHTLAAAVLLGSAVLAAGAWGLREGAARATLVALCCAGVAVVGATRVYLGVHWLSDVIGGALLGGLLLALACMLIASGRLEPILRRRRSIPSAP